MFQNCVRSQKVKGTELTKAELMMVFLSRRVDKCSCNQESFQTQSLCVVLTGGHKVSDVNEIVKQNGTYVFFPLDFDIKRIWKQSECNLLCLAAGATR